MVTVPTAERKVGPNQVRLPSVTPTPATPAGATASAFGGKTAAAVGGLGDSIQGVGDDMVQASIKIQKRKNSRERLKAYAQYQGEAAEAFRNMMETEDLTDDATAMKYNAMLAENRQKLLDSHEGGPLSSTELDNVLLESQSAFSTKVTDEVFKAHKAADDLAIEDVGNNLYVKTFQNASAVGQAMQEVDAMVRNFSEGMSPQQAESMERILRSRVLEGALDNFLASGDYSAVYKIINDNPDVGAILGTEASERVLRKARAMETGTGDDNINIEVHLDNEKRESLVTAFGEEQGKIMSEKLEAGMKAQDQLALLGAQKELLSRTDPGIAHGPRQVAARIGAFFNADQETMNKFRMGDPAAAEVFTAIADEMTADIVQQGGRITDLFIQTVKGQLPQLTMTPEGIEILIELRTRMADREIAEAKIIEKYMKLNSANPPNEPGLFTERLQLRQDQPILDPEFKALLNKTANAAPDTWLENVIQMGSQIAGEAGVPEERVPELKAAMETTFPGWTYAGVDPDSGEVMMDHPDYDTMLIGQFGNEILEGIDALTAEAGEATENPSETPAAQPAAATSSFRDKVEGAESGGKADAESESSTATGLHQFTEGTWLEQIEKAGVDTEGKSREEILELRKNPEVSRQVFETFTAGNSKALEARGHEANDANLFLTHFAGTTGGPDLLDADPEAKVSTVLSKGAMDANPFMKDMTVGELRAWAAGKVK